MARIPSLRASVLGVAIAVVGAYWVYYATALPDERLVEIAVDHVAFLPDRVIATTPTEGASFHTPPYGSGTSLKEDFPGCCFIGRTPSDDLPGDCAIVPSRVVTVRYAPRYPAERETLPKVRVTRQIAITLHGRVCRELDE